jgi:hypothetical protein
MALAKELKPGTWDAVQALALASIAQSRPAMIENRRQEEAWEPAGADRQAPIRPPLGSPPARRALGPLATLLAAGTGVTLDWFRMDQGREAPGEVSHQDLCHGVPLSPVDGGTAMPPALSTLWCRCTAVDPDVYSPSSGP